MKFIALLQFLLQAYICFGNIQSENNQKSCDVRFKINDSLVFKGNNFARSVDFNDTVIFDLAQLSGSSNYLEFPVVIVSDDTVNSLDFSFRFNHPSYVFDTVTDLTGTLEYLSHFNEADNTLRFTSNSFTDYPIQSTVVSVGFDVLDFSFCQLNIYNAVAYLNGEPCAVKIKDCPLPTHTGKNDLSFNAYPNPSFDYLIVEHEKPCELILYDLSGKIVYMKKDEGDKVTIPVIDLSAGMYFLEVRINRLQIIQKLVVLH